MPGETYLSHGCCLISDTPLPGLTLAPATDAKRPWISIKSCPPGPDRPGQLAPEPGAAPRESKKYRLGRYQLDIVFQEDETGFVLLFLGVAEFHISRDGRTVSYRPDGDAPGRSNNTLIQELLTGCILSFCLALQGIFPLHGGAVVSDAGAVAFIGPAGHGKSSLIATCISRGWRLLSDGMVVFQELGPEFWGQPGSPIVRLRPDATANLVGNQGFFRKSSSVPGFETTKRGVNVGNDWGELASQPCRLDRLYLLEPSEECRSAELVNCSGWDAVRAVMANTYTIHIHPKSLSVPHFQFAARLLSSVPLKILRYPRGLEFLPQMFEAICGDVRHFSHPRQFPAVELAEKTQ